MRLLHAGHGDERGRPAAPQRRAERAARSATGSRATSAAAPATTTSSRRCRRRRAELRERRVKDQGIGARGPAQGGPALPHRHAAATSTTSTAAASSGRSIVRSPLRARAHHAASTRRPRAAAPGVVAVFTGADIAADDVGGMPCGWLIQTNDGKPMVEPPHPARRRARAPRGRHGRRGDRRDARAGARGRGACCRGRLRGAARRWRRCADAIARGRAAGLGRGARQHLLRLGHRRPQAGPTPPSRAPHTS